MKFSRENSPVYRLTRRDAILVPLRAAAAGLLASLPSNGAMEWQRGVVEAVHGGQFSSIRVDKYGNAHVSTFSPESESLWYGFWDHALNKWFGTRVDRSSGFCSLALDSHQHPHISYIEFGTGRLKYAFWDGNQWRKEPLMIQAKLISYNTSIVLDREDRPVISLYEEYGLGLEKTFLRLVSWNGQYWELRTVDTDEGSGKFNSVGLSSTGTPMIAYGNVKYENASLRFAYWTGSSWKVEILEGEGRPGTSMYSVTLLVDRSDVPHIAYTDVANRLIKYAVKRDGKWRLQVVDAISRMAYPDRNGLALDDDGTTYISYYDAGPGLLKVAYQDGGKWINEVVDGNHSGFTNCLRVAGRTMWLTYSDETGEVLRFARGELPQRPAEAPGDRAGAPATARGK